MIRWMLEQMERSPRAVFYEKELRERFSEEFQTARDAKLLRSVPTRLDGGTYSRGLAKPYLVLEDEGSLEAFDDEDPEAEPIPLTMADLARWRLDLDVLARRFQRANGLVGKPGPLDPRLLFLGEKPIRGTRTAFVLAFLDGAGAPTTLAAIPALLPAGYGSVTVVCPTFQPDPACTRLIESNRLFVIRLGQGDVFEVPDVEAIPGVSPEQYVLQRAGDHWRVVYEGRETSVHHLSGFNTLAILLRTPYREYDVTDLAREEDELALSAEGRGELAMLSSGQLADMGMHRADQGDAGPAVDAEAIAAAREALAALGSDIEEAQRVGDATHEKELRRQHDTVRRYISGSVGRGGRRRRAASSSERARTTVTNRLRYAISRLGAADEALGIFLKHSIRTGRRCSYYPDRPVAWTVWNG